MWDPYDVTFWIISAVKRLYKYALIPPLPLDTPTLCLTMLFDPLWLFLVLSLGSSVPASLGQGLQAALDQQLHGHRGQEPVFFAAPPIQEDKPSGGTIYKILSDDPKFSRVIKAVNFVEDVASLLDDSSAK